MLEKEERREDHQRGSHETEGARSGGRSVVGLWAVLGQEVTAPQNTSTQQRRSTLSEKYSYLLNSICSPWPGSQLLAGVKPQLTPLPANILVVYHSFEQTVSTASPCTCVVLPGLCDCCLHTEHFLVNSVVFVTGTAQGQPDTSGWAAQHSVTMVAGMGLI